MPTSGDAQKSSSGSTRVSVANCESKRISSVHAQAMTQVLAFSRWFKTRGYSVASRLDKSQLIVTSSGEKSLLSIEISLADPAGQAF